MFKKIISIALMIVMATSLAACKGGNVATKDGKPLLADGKYKITDEYTELSYFYGASKTPDGEYQTFKDAAEYTNVYVKPTLPKSNSDFQQAFNLMVASGEMPDIVQHYNDSQFSQLGSEGAFEPIDEHFDIMPNFKKLLDERPEIRDRITFSDGHIYYVPVVNEGKVSAGWVVRQDWLDKLGLEHPKSVDELYNVLKAFKTQDPNGNGKADEVPYFDNFDTLLTLFDAYPDWYMDENGKAKFGPAQPEFKTAMTTLRKWFAEGLIDTEIFSGQIMRDRRNSDNVGGMTHNWFASSLMFNDKLKDKIEGFNMVAMLPPTGVERDQRPASYEYGWGVSASSKNKEIALKFIDFWYSDAGIRLMSWGVEGVHYDIVDGKPKFKDELLTDPEFLDAFRAMKANDSGTMGDREAEIQMVSTVGVLEAWDAYEKNVKYTELFPLVDMYFSSKDLDKYTKMYTEITTYASELKQKWILGSADIDATYDEYINQLNKFGLAEMTEMVQNAIDNRK